MQNEITIKAYQTFDSMGIKDELLRSIYSFGFEKPTAIQQKAIVPFIQGRNIIVQGQFVTGKTLAFTIGTLQQIEVEKKCCQAILLVPTGDLALQTQEVVKNLSQYLDIDVFACIGGTSIKETIEILKKGVHIVVGTPGRVYDMIERGVIDTNKIKVLVLDEADELLSNKFKDEIYKILESIPKSVQVGLFSSTMSPEAFEISKKFMENPVEIVANEEESTIEGIKQFYIDVNKEEYKIDTLVDLYQSISCNQSLIFCNSKERVEWIQRKLTAHNYPVSIIHDKISNEDRQRGLTEFREGRTRILISTDVLPRGIDFNQVSLVVNFDMPTNDETYIHRIGRSALLGRKGIAINFITNEEMERINVLNEKYNTKIVTLPKNFMDYL